MNLTPTSEPAVTVPGVSRPDQEDRAPDFSSGLSRRLIWFSWACVVYVVFVIAWGAFVRASGSGAGCGSHWPLCNGDVLPKAPSAATLVEFSHRLTSGLSLLLVAGLFFWVRMISLSGSVLRRAAKWSLIFILGEALVGAILVLQHLVAGDSSVARAVVIALHLVNTQLLVAALVWTAMTISFPTGVKAVFGADGQENDTAREDLLGSVPELYRRLLRIAAIFLVVGATGAIVALGDTLFPADSLTAGLRQDFDSAAHFLVRLRILHPLVAVGAALALWLFVAKVEKYCEFSDLLSKSVFFVRFSLAAQIVIGILNWLLLAPTWLQLVHLVGSNAVWISLVILAFCLKFIAKSETVR